MVRFEEKVVMTFGIITKNFAAVCIIDLILMKEFQKRVYTLIGIIPCTVWQFRFIWMNFPWGLDIQKRNVLFTEKVVQFQYVRFRPFH